MVEEKSRETLFLGCNFQKKRGILPLLSSHITKMHCTNTAISIVLRVYLNVKQVSSFDHF